MNITANWKKTGSTSPTLLVWLIFSLLWMIFDLVFANYFPLKHHLMGDDYSLALPAWLDGHMWFKNNGLSVPWFTPSFCAGQPFFPDPQSGYYALPQWLAIAVGPLQAAHGTLLASAALLFWGVYLLMRKVFATGTTVAVLVGGLLMFNGFLPYRMIVGHIGYHGFALVPWIALLLLMPLRRSIHSWTAALIAGLLLAYWVQSGFGTLMLAAGLSILLIACLYGLRDGSLTRFFGRSALASLIGLGLSAAKLWAGISFLSHFPRTSYLLPGAGNFLDALIVVASGLFLPSQWAFDVANPRLVNVQWMQAPHEWAYGFGITTALLLIALLLNWLRFKPWRCVNSTTLRQALLSTVLVLGLIVPIALNIWTPEWNAFLKTLPAIKSSSTLLRWMIVYIPVVAVIIGLLLERAQWGRFTHVAAGLCLMGVIGQAIWEPHGYYLSQGYDSKPMVIGDALLRSGKLTPSINMLGNAVDVQIGKYHKQLRSNDTLIAGVSQTACYNPIFGYRLENFSAQNLAPGSVLAVNDGFLNLKNPACYVYPKENNCQPGDRFKADQLEQAQAFINYKPFAFNISEGQRIANTVTKFSLYFTLLWILGWLICLLRKKR